MEGDRAVEADWERGDRSKLEGSGGGVVKGGAVEFQRWPRCGWHRWNGRFRNSEIGELDGVCLGVVTTSWMTEPDVAGGGAAGRQRSEHQQGGSVSFK